jgi:RHH-type transcriptional regulator, rel operon repressor / antitoxin RelB
MPTSVRLSQEDEIRLDSLSRETGKSKAFYIQEAVASYLDDMEDFILAEKRLDEAKKGQEQVYTLEEVERELGLEN